MLALSHKKMIVWKKSFELLKKVYQITAEFPGEEKFELVRQLRKAGISVISNIAEGEVRRTSKEKRRFYEMARSSIVEIDAQIEIAVALEIIEEKSLTRLSGLLNECFAMLSKLGSIQLTVS